MGKHFLSIGIPSNRPLATSAEALYSAIGYCTKTASQLVVSDNSGAADKAADLAQRMSSPGLDYIKSPPCGMMDNWFQAFNATDATFVMMMGDDDRIFSFGEAPDFKNIGDDVVAIKPCLFSYADPRGIQQVNFVAVDAPTAPDRIAQNRQAAQGTNMAIFSFWRRSVFKSIMDLWFLHHPTKGTYCDWAVMNALVSSGKVIVDPSVCYFYNLQNWAGTPDVIQAQIDRAFTSAGLPKGSSRYGSLFNAIDSFIFINRSDSSLPEQERGLSAIVCFDYYLKDYIHNMPQQTEHDNAAEVYKISRKLVGNDSVVDIFNIFVEIFDAIKPGLGQQYRDFGVFATGKAWGNL